MLLMYFLERILDTMPTDETAITICQDKKLYVLKTMSGVSVHQN